MVSKRLLCISPSRRIYGEVEMFFMVPKKSDILASSMENHTVYMYNIIQFSKLFLILYEI